MKKLILIWLLLLTCFSVSVAQDSGIRFEQTKKWKQIVSKAKKEKKLIFVDCYTDWCGPCKIMAHSVFTQDSVGGFFNQYFVNAKFEMERDEDGKMLRSKYRVEAYPTLLFIDPVTQEEVMRVVGMRTADALLLYAAIAMDPEHEKNTAGLKKRYLAGDRDVDFLKHYYRVLEESILPEKEKIAKEFLDSADIERLVAKENWDMFVQYINDPLAKPFRVIMANRERFYGELGQRAVDYKLEYTIEDAADELINWTPEKGDFNVMRNEKFIQFLKSVDSPVVPGVLASLYASGCVREGDYQGLVNNIRNALEYNLFRGNKEKKFLERNVKVLENCTDRSLIRDVVRLLDEKCGQAMTCYGKADLMKLKAVLQLQMGDEAGAQQSKEQEAKFRAEGDERGEWMD
ncbi:MULTISPECIES: thioredoxin domain-containing protein [unclassified Butyricimonas]|uniref:thioredoxin family protein n=1 Tax=unclassified Butyricimonas TaxID=2637652 RepID=UPI000C07ED56|nr:MULTISPECIES: thioredoxin domain-containing protein [unclassified Butyricimonas]